MKTEASASITQLSHFKTQQKRVSPPQTTPLKSSSASAKHDRFLKIQAVLDRVGIARSTVYAYMETGNFPTPIKIGRASFWSEIEITAWMDALKKQAGKQ